jgi:GNAT superfamily N-acetyltransferase
VLGPARLHHTLAHGYVISKAAAGTYLAELFPSTPASRRVPPGGVVAGVQEQDAGGAASVRDHGSRLPCGWEIAMSDYAIRPLGPATWDAFARLAEKHNGVWNGCWCTWFHPACADRGVSPEGNRAIKERLVHEGRAHAAVVFDGDRAVGWCQFGSPEELPSIYHRKEYTAGLVRLPDYRLTCFFIDRDYRRQGVAAVALRGALDLIAQAGGGVVEAYPQDTQGKKVSGSFLYSGTRSLFEKAAFTYDRPKGKNHCVMSRTVEGLDRSIRKP